jgi:hypothetical protein
MSGDLRALAEKYVALNGIWIEKPAWVSGFWIAGEQGIAATAMNSGWAMAAPFSGSPLSVIRRRAGA